MSTITVTCKRKRWTLTFSKLPGQSFGPYELGDAIEQVWFAALFDTKIEARNLVLDAAVNGSATTEMGGGQ